jgi:hypothetical protein
MGGVLVGPCGPSGRGFNVATCLRPTARTGPARRQKRLVGRRGFLRRATLPCGGSARLCSVKQDARDRRQPTVVAIAVEETRGPCGQPVAAGLVWSCRERRRPDVPHGPRGEAWPG